MATIKNDLVTGLVSVWLSDSTAIITDLHGTNNLTNNNSVVTTTLVQGNAGDFELDSSQSLSITDAAQSGLDIIGDMSFAAWVKLEAIANTNEILNKSYGSTNQAYSFKIKNNTGTPALQVEISSDGGITNKDTFNQPVATVVVGTTYMVGFSWDASASTARFYLDGSNVGGNLVGSQTSCFNSTSPFVIGCRGSFGGDFFDGIINQVCVWNAVLTDGNFSTFYNAGVGIPYESAVSGPANLKTRDTITKANTKTIETIAMADIKTIDTIS